jgi:hypothetical protein
MHPTRLERVTYSSVDCKSICAFNFRDVDRTNSLGTDDSRLGTRSSGDEYDFLHRFLGIHFHHHFLDGAVA